MSKQPLTKIALKELRLERLLGRKLDQSNPEDKSMLFHLYCGDTPERVIEIRNYNLKCKEERGC